jgi:acetyl-CoA synthetase
VPLFGLSEALKATKAAIQPMAVDLNQSVLGSTASGELVTLSEHQAKLTLGQFGLDLPVSTSTNLGDLANSIKGMKYPLVLKGEGFAHKTENNAVALRLPDADAVMSAANGMDCDKFLIEEMIEDAVAELIVGVARDPAHGFILTIGAGGILTELLDDKQNLLIPASEASIRAALSTLKINRILNGYRGKPAANRSKTIEAIMAIQNYVAAHANSVAEVEVNPLICTPNRAVAVDALIRKSNV